MNPPKHGAVGSAMTWTRSLEETVTVDAPSDTVFAWLDEPRNTGLHMSRPSMAMLGGTLRFEQVSAHGTGVGATYRSWGRVLGLPIDFTTAVTAWVPGRQKVWRTVGKPRLIVLADFQMRFSLTGREGRTDLMLAIDYNMLAGGVGRLLGRLLAAPYVRWCLRRMASDARSAFKSERARPRA
jgi:hypothetical protein